MSPSVDSRDLLSRARACCKRFCRANDAVAAVEFALIMPLLLLMYIGAVEASRALSYDRRLTSAAATLGDLVAQTKGDLTHAELNDLFKAATITVTPQSATLLRQVVSNVFVDGSGKGTVIWSEGYNGGTPYPKDADFTLPKAFTDIASGTWVIVSEASMMYQPITSFVYKSGIPLSKEYFYAPRFGDFIDIK